MPISATETRRRSGTPGLPGECNLSYNVKRESRMKAPTPWMFHQLRSSNQPTCLIVSSTEFRLPRRCHINTKGTVHPLKTLIWLPTSPLRAWATGIIDNTLLLLSQCRTTTFTTISPTSSPPSRHPSLLPVLVLLILPPGTPSLL